MLLCYVEQKPLTLLCKLLLFLARGLLAGNCCRAAEVRETVTPDAEKGEIRHACVTCKSVPAETSSSKDSSGLTLTKPT